MAKKIVCVRDSKTEIFGAPALCMNLAEGERMFNDLISDSSSVLAKHPEDFALWCLGVYDETNGSILTEGCPFVVVSGESRS